MARDRVVEVDGVGLDQFRRELRALGREWPRELRKAHREVGNIATRSARIRAQRMGGVQAKAASAIQTGATDREATVRVAVSTRHPYAQGAFWGSKQYPQFKSWVGNSWDVGVAGEGPYAINPAIAAESGAIVARFDELIDDITRRAFPDR